ncbi:hypothetical protein GF357_03600 [Candidatus Dojkabacteria bacterium]|nr:hypothetical protein [Candidatus Dojkabacteria bacterium]
MRPKTLLRKLMKFSTRKIIIGVWFAGMLLTNLATEIYSYTCYPTCHTKDGVFLSKVKNGSMYSFVDLVEKYYFIASSDSDTIEIGIFDGDVGKSASNLNQGAWWNGNWDTTNHDVIYRLYTDPDFDGIGNDLIAEWNSNLENIPGQDDIWTAVAPGMDNNDWWTVIVQNTEASRALNGEYRYLMETLFSDSPLYPGPGNAMHKFRTDGYFLTSNYIFGVVGMAATIDDFEIVYEGWDGSDFTWFDDYDQKMAGSNHPGVIDFYFNVPVAVDKFSIWDGDFDYGSIDGSTVDTDDTNTPNDILPVFAEVGTPFEGAKGMGEDDGVSPIFTFQPSVYYEVITSSGTYLNSNPAGVDEWENFVISMNSDDNPDYLVGNKLDAGIYNLKVTGADFQNMLFFKTSYSMTGVDETGEPQIPPTPYFIGQSVWLDENKNGDFDESESGIPGVELNIYDSDDFLLDTLITDSEGFYSFGTNGEVSDPYTSEIIDDGIYRVEVTQSSLEGILRDHEITTGSTDLTHKVVDENVYLYNFGFMKPEELPDTGKGVDNIIAFGSTLLFLTGLISRFLLSVEMSEPFMQETNL